MGLKQQNLINYNTTISQGQRLIKIGNSFIPVGTLNSSTEDYDLYVVVDINGQKKVQKLAFQGTTASDDGQPETLQNIKIFNTGYPEPSNSSSTSINSINFYKCTSIDASLSTWTGKKAILSGDNYIFQNNITSGLTYNKFKPKIDKIYSENTAIFVNQLYSNLHDPNTIFLLDPETLIDKTGNFTLINQYGTVSSTIGTILDSYQLIFQGQNKLHFESQTTTIGGNVDYTLEMFYTKIGEGTFPPILNIPNGQIHLGQYGNYFTIWQEGNDNYELSNVEFVNNVRHHIVISRRATDNNWKAWIDGQMCMDWNLGQYSSNTAFNDVTIGNDNSIGRQNNFIIEQYRISNCIRYTEDQFQVPTEPLT